MYRRHGNKLGLVFLACDLSVTASVWIAAYFIRFDVWRSPDGIPDCHLMFGALPSVLIMAAVSYRLCGLYAIHRLKQLPYELGVIFKSSGLLFVLATTVAFYRRDLYESRLAFALFLALNVAGLLLVRRILWHILRFFRDRGLNHGRALIVGTGRPGRRVSRTIIDNNWTGLEVVGFVDDRQEVEPTCTPRLGRIDDLHRIVDKHNVDHVFVALPFNRYGELPKVYDALSDILVEVQLVPDIPNMAGMKLRMSEIDDIAFLNLRTNPHSGWGKFSKRAMDLIIGLIALVILSPLMLAVAIAIKLTSRAPVLFRQSRTGLGGRTFNMLKFRSMRPDAENQVGPIWATRNDRRCTRIGRILRRWSLDELPQLINVIVGDMSLVGPRPERCVLVEKFRKQIPGYAQRHQVKCGMTGWAQVNGWRGNTSLRHRIQCDLFYIANWSTYLDLKILFMTIWCGLRHRNAY